MKTLLATLLLVAGLAAAPPQDAGKGPPGQTGAPPEGEDPSGIGDRADAAVSATPMPRLDVRVDQDPLRIAPGETGLLVLFVMMPERGTKVAPGGTVKLQNQQGPLTFGGAQWSDPPSGKAAYEGGFLIRVPVTVAGTAKHGKYPVSGSLSLPSVFGAPSGDAARAEGVVDAPKANGPLSQGFAGNLVVGPPMPKPRGVPRRRGTTKKQPTSTQKAEAKAAPEAPEKERAPARAGRDRPANPEEVGPGSVPGVDTGEEPMDSPIGTLAWIAGAVVLAFGLLLLLMRRR